MLALTKAAVVRAHVEECKDADESQLIQMQAKLQYVGIDRLPAHIGKKVRLPMEDYMLL